MGVLLCLKQNESFAQICFRFKRNVRQLFSRGKDKSKCVKCEERCEEGRKDCFIECLSQKCRGFYCLECFKELDNQCKICRLTLVNYEVLNESSQLEISFEKDSSDDDDDDEK